VVQNEGIAMIVHWQAHQKPSINHSGLAVPPGDSVPANGHGWSLKQTFAALKYRNYRLWFIGQMASLVGTFMQATALGFFIFELTHSPAYLGYVGLANGIPSWFFMLYAGVISDRMPRRTLLIITQIYMMILACILATMTLAGIVRPWHILILAFLLGIGHAFDAPARHSFVLEMVTRDDLTNAIALNSTMFNAATMLGPAFAGVIYAVAGPGPCFVINAMSFLAVIVALKMMRIEYRNNRSRKTSTLQDLKEGLIYIWSQPLIRILIVVAWIISLFGMSYVTLMPAWAVNVLKGDAATNGWLQSVRGAGALCGALMIASMGRFQFKGKLISLGTIMVPVLLLAFSFVSWLPLSLLALLGIGWSIITVFNLVNSSIQSLVDDDLRGRVMSIYSLVFFGSMPIGSFLTGLMAEVTNEPAAVMVNAAVALMAATIIWIRLPDLRQLQ
jgi:MFS family permease